MPSRALRRDARVTLYLPARYRRTTAYPLLVVHDGGDYLQYAAAKTVLDNLIHRLEVAELVAAFLHPGDRLVEYADSTAHARFVTGELLPHLERRLPLAGQPAGRCLMGASFGAVAALSTAYRHRDTYGSLLLQSGSFVFTDIGTEHGGGPVFDPVVRFTNRYRARPRAVADRVFVSCGVYEPLIVRNRSMVPVLSGDRDAGPVRRVPRRAQLGELAGPAPGRADLGVSRAAEAGVRVADGRARTADRRTGSSVLSPSLRYSRGERSSRSIVAANAGAPCYPLVVAAD